MRTLYITGHGKQLKRVSRRICVKKDGKIIEEIPILDLKRILVFGNNQMTTDLMRFLSAKGIEVAFLSLNGRFRFRIVPELSKNIFIRKAQHSRYESQAFRISWSLSIVKAKLSNQRNFLIRSGRNHSDIDFFRETDMLKKSIVELEEKTTLEEIRGAEGFGSKVFFSAYAKLLKRGFIFKKREYYPPPDPVNALLSFGYMLVFNELNSLISAFGMEPYVGYLHGIKYGRASLASDLLEEFRSPIVDRLVMFLINNGVINTNQFNETQEHGVRMDENAISAFLKNYERYMTTPFTEKRTRDFLSYREIIRRNVEKAEKSIMENIKYEPHFFYA